jgi:putative hydrolase of the HAD superfamily
MAAFSSIRNIIFDLGGVLYDIDYERVEREFARLQQRSANASPHTAPHVQYTRSVQPEVFTQFETGNISAAAFREALRAELGLLGTDEELDAAWNSMLLGVYEGREELLRRLKPYFGMVLLSNTNATHVEYVRPACAGIFAELDRLFFSHEMGTRKPLPEIFQMVLDTMNWKANETLFVDDSAQHLKGAQTLGIHTLWLQNPQDLEHTASFLLASHNH